MTTTNRCVHFSTLALSVSLATLVLVRVSSSDSKVGAFELDTPVARTCSHNLTFKTSHDDDEKRVEYTVLEDSRRRDERRFYIWSGELLLCRVIVSQHAFEGRSRLRVEWSETQEPTSDSVCVVSEVSTNRTSHCLDASGAEALVVGHLEATLPLPAYDGTFVRVRDGHVFDVWGVERTKTTKGERECARASAVHVGRDVVQEGPNVEWTECRTSIGGVLVREASVAYFVRAMGIENANHTREESEDVDMSGTDHTVCRQSSAFELRSTYSRFLVSHVEEVVSDEALLLQNAVLFRHWNETEPDGIDDDDAGLGRRLQSGVPVSGLWGLPPGVFLQPGGVVRGLYQFDGVRVVGRTYQILLRATYTRPNHLEVDAWIRRRGGALTVRVLAYTTSVNGGGAGPLVKIPIWSSAITLFRFGPISLRFTPSVAARLDTQLFASVDRVFVELAAALEIKAKVTIATPCLLVLRVELGVKLVGRVMNQMIRFGVYSSVPGVALWNGPVCVELRHFSIGLRLQLSPSCEVCKGWRCKRCKTCLRTLVNRLAFSWVFGRSPDTIIATSCGSAGVSSPYPPPGSAPRSSPPSPPPPLQLALPPQLPFTPCLSSDNQASCLR